MKVAELTGVMLDYWVAKAEGHPFEVHGGLSNPECWVAVRVDSRYEQSRDASLICAADSYAQYEPYCPSEDWGWAGPIIEREKIEISYIDHGCWYARVNPNAVSPDGLQPHEGSTPLIAAMRSYVALKFGDEVQ